MTFNVGDVVAFREDLIRENKMIINIENKLRVLETYDDGRTCVVDAKLRYPNINEGISSWSSGWFTLYESSRVSVEDML